MAVTRQDDTFQLTEQGDRIDISLIVQSVWFTAEAGSVATDLITLSAPDGGGVLWQEYAGGPSGSSHRLVQAGPKSGRVWCEGVELTSLPGNNGTVFVQYV